MKFLGSRPRWLAFTRPANARMVVAVRNWQTELNSVGDAQLADLYNALRGSDMGIGKDDNKVTLAFALALQSLKRTTGMEAYDVQLLGGLALANGAIAEMQTGEGKTLTTMFPIAAMAWSGKGVHVATVNEYLAERDYESLKPALDLLGITAGISRSGDPPATKREAYDCDVTFATGYELGFDFLRDHIALEQRNTNRLGSELRRRLTCVQESERETIQRNFASLIIDEVDSVLIDEAITPLVLSAGTMGSNVDESVYHAAKSSASQMKEGVDFIIQPRHKTITLTEEGNTKIQQHFESDLQQNLCTQLLRPWNQYVESALRAKHIMIRDVSYIVRDDKIEIVDEYTGRIFSDRNWRDGLHQAVEAKENVPINEERKTIAKISRQRYFARYDMLCGMTGTADGHQAEFKTCYGTNVVIIPRRQPLRRVELPTRYFKTEDDKFAAIVTDSIVRQTKGQPVLIGTRTIAQSIELSARFGQQEIAHKVLNGVQDEQEANLIAGAGQSGTITVATNMAGRGTDIKLDAASVDAGGLHVIGIERSSSLRVDRQLLGRSGRQGDPGSGQFYVSADDELLDRFVSKLNKQLQRIRKSGGIANQNFDRQIEAIQKRAEAASYQSRQEIMREELWLDNIKKAVAQ